jgi:pyrimidine/purine-5'-nucleotide nucleosidase
MPNSSQPIRIQPTSSFRDLSHREVHRFLDASTPELKHLFRNCALAVMNGGAYTDDATEVFHAFRDFRIEVVAEHRGVELEVHNAPASAFVDGVMVRGIRDLLYAVLRDIIHINDDWERALPSADEDPELAGAATTDAVFNVLRNADVLYPYVRPNLVVCWGGHSISRHEYDYTKEVGYALGLRGLDICTGCGPGAMKGPMKGAHIGHAKQRTSGHRYLGITEPGIIAAESPNPIVNELVIMPDIEKRLEAFVRAGHAIIVFPGGVGTAEEILYLLGVLMDERNRDLPFPVVFTGPRSAAAYFEEIDAFIGATLGEASRARYKIITDDPAAVAREIKQGISAVEAYRTEHRDAWHFNWSLKIPRSFQLPFNPTHSNMAALSLDPQRASSELATDLRRAFSGIVAGNVKPDGVAAVREHGPFELHGAPHLMRALDQLLQGFCDQGRMKIGDDGYEPCYRMS